MRKWFISSLVLLPILLSVVFTSLPAHAASPFDNVITPTDDLTVHSYPTGSLSYDVTTLYLQIISQECENGPALVADLAGATYYAVVEYRPIGTSNYSTITVHWTYDSYPANPEAAVAWSESGGSYRALTYAEANASFYVEDDGDVRCYGNTHDEPAPYLAYLGRDPRSSGTGNPWVYESSYPNPNPPEDYDGPEIPGAVTPPTPEILDPEYKFTVTKNEDSTGRLQVNYLDNLPHFLTGISYLVVEKMTPNWEELDETIYSESQNPAGWAEWVAELPAGEGWYMMRIDHNQQLDEPPWPEGNHYEIGQPYYQFYWDGNKAISGAIVDCSGVVCNPQKDTEKPQNSWLNSIKIDSYGLAAFITAPLEFFQALPGAVASCTALDLPLPGASMQIPCMTPWYSANLGVFFTIYQTVILGGFSYFMGLNLFHRIKHISNPKNDQIEVVHL